MAIFFACGVGFTKVRPTRRKLRSRLVIFQFPMLFVRDCSLSAAANGFSSPKTHRRRRSIRGTRSSVTFVLRFARTESKLVAGTISGTHWEPRCVSTDGPRKSGPTFSGIQACRLRMVCTTTRTKTIPAKRSPELPLSCYEMLRNHKSQIRKFLKTKGLVPVVGLEPTT